MSLGGKARYRSCLADILAARTGPTPNTLVTVVCACLTAARIRRSSSATSRSRRRMSPMRSDASRRRARAGPLRGGTERSSPRRHPPRGS